MKKYSVAFIIRAVVASAVLLFFLFFYLRMGTGGDFFGYAMNWQFSARAVGVGVMSGAVILFTALACVAGRVFCSAFCPMGSIQELVWRISSALKFKPELKKYVVPWKIRYAVPLIAAIGIMSARQPLYIMMDPISNFGRGMTAILEIISGEFEGIFFMLAVFFLITLFFACIRGRRFCDWCPVGVVLGFAASAAPFGVRIDAGKCVSCGHCESACPMNCADSSGKKADAGRCVLCLECARSCPTGAVSFSRAAPPEKFLMASRRNFVKRAGAFIIGASYLGGRNLKNLARRSAPQPTSAIGAVKLVAGVALPPGGVDADRYHSTCVACEACVHACPVGIIKLDGATQPHVVYGDEFCQFNCVECGKVCPTNAITRLGAAVKRRTRIGVSSITLRRCVVIEKGQSCGACAEVCPTHALMMTPYAVNQELTVPSFDEEYCIGCGACVAVCPAEPNAFAISGVMRQTLTPGIREGSGIESDVDDLVPMTEGDDFPF